VFSASVLQPEGAGLNSLHPYKQSAVQSADRMANRSLIVAPVLAHVLFVITTILAVFKNVPAACLFAVFALAAAFYERAPRSLRMVRALSDPYDVIALSAMFSLPALVISLVAVSVAAVILFYASSSVVELPVDSAPSPSNGSSSTSYLDLFFSLFSTEPSSTFILFHIVIVVTELHVFFQVIRIPYLGQLQMSLARALGSFAAGYPQNVTASLSYSVLNTVWLAILFYTFTCQWKAVDDIAIGFFILLSVIIAAYIFCAQAFTLVTAVFVCWAVLFCQRFGVVGLFFMHAIVAVSGAAAFFINKAITTAVAQNAGHRQVTGGVIRNGGTPARNSALGAFERSKSLVRTIPSTMAKPRSSTSQTSLAARRS
jgi:hypothetical protein